MLIWRLSQANSLSTKSNASLTKPSVWPPLPQERRGLPSTLEGFKAHEVYVLDRHIGKYQAVRPGAQKCGNHRCGGWSECAGCGMWGARWLAGGRQ